GMNIFNVALITRAFLFFAYPTKMSGDQVWVSTGNVLGIGGNSPQTIDAFSGATPLGQVAVAEKGSELAITNIVGQPSSVWDAIVGLIPGSIGETSIIAIALGAALLLFTGVASWKIMLSVFAGGALTGFLFNTIGPDTPIAHLPWWYHLILGGFAFGAVFMATDPVTASRTETGKWIYGFLIGVMAIIIRVLNPGYPEGMMLAILLMNVFAPLIDYYVVQANIKRREKRVTIKN
ncbi:RnfABCDGE type electron transport complex subunit D, partial [Bacteroidales bacterium OttesenSCG-928-I21]|nr:RnfABCDGE type electron transport complex subunit D [Bacteroidales bacterium OttesenSCG-928-I21]